MALNQTVLRFILPFCLLISFISTGLVHAETVKIISWNVKDIMKVQDVNSRRAELKKAGDELAPDILLLQEITSRSLAEAVRDAMGLTGYSVACSDFVQSDGSNRGAFEVAIISKHPITQIIEYDPSPDNQGSNEPDEVKLEPLKKIGIEKIGTSRGFLWANFEKLKLTVMVVHLKSSLGRVGAEDLNNAKKRELVAAAVAAGVNEDQQLFDDYAYLVGGDFNVGHSDKKKNGRSLKKDCHQNCGNKDKYDETHALLSKGLVGSLKMKNLVFHLKDTTYPGFAGSPIDNIYVTGDRVGKFTNGQRATKTYGSDHLAVWTTYEVGN